jgi:alkylation response protein AidB-like acyl-CoA dehydrogenase
VSAGQSNAGQSNAVSLLYSDVEEELRASVRSLLEDRSPWNAILARCETDQPYDIATWRTLASGLGCAGLAIPEKHGGEGASWREVAVVAEELGRACAPMPFLTSAVVATAAALELDDADLAERLANGQTTVVLAAPFSMAPGAPFPATVTADELSHLSGRVTSVADAEFADVLLVPATTPTGPALFAVDINEDMSGLTRDAVVSLDLTRPLYDVTFTDVPARRLAVGDATVAALNRALTVGAAVLASEQLGIAQACLDMTVEYLKTRYQFGRLIGSYQALKHRAADLWASVTQARAVARYAAACVASDDPDTPVAVALAQAYCSGVAVRAAEDCVQLHGGIGFTWEHPAHLYLKRAKSTSLALGTASRHRSALGHLVNLPA